LPIIAAYLGEILFRIYLRTFLAAPLVSGFLLGRYAPMLIRYIITLWIIDAGLVLCIFSEHGFEAYVLGNFLFIGTNMTGLSLRAKAKHIDFWAQKHLDWILVFVSTLVFMSMYVRPTM
jgi:hypothetical protein